MCFPHFPETLRNPQARFTPLFGCLMIYCDSFVSGVKDSATLNITRLYQGYFDSFQITSSQWLVDNKWLLASQAEKVMYIKSFELFLPTVSEDSVTFISKSFSSGEFRDIIQIILTNCNRRETRKETGSLLLNN